MVEINNCCMHCTPLTFESGYARALQLKIVVRGAASQLNFDTNVFGLQEFVDSIKATFAP